MVYYMVVNNCKCMNYKNIEIVVRNEVKLKKIF